MPKRPRFAEAYNNLGNALLDKGQRDEAIAAYQKALAIKKNYPEAQRNLARALQQKAQSGTVAPP